MKDLELYLIPGRNIPKEFREIYEKTYSMWKKVWIDTMTDEWSQKEGMIYSDEFTRQDEILTLFYKGECVGCVFMKSADFHESCARDDSYFKVWNDLAIQKLIRKGKNILVCCNFTVAKQFRRTQDGIRWKDVLATMAVKRLEYSDFDAMTGTMRRSKGMHTTTLKVGAQMVQENVDYFICGINEPVDLVVFYRDSIQLNLSAEIEEMIDQTWQRVVALALPLYYHVERVEQGDNIIRMSG